MQTRTKTALIGAATSAVALPLTWLIALHTGFGANADRAIFNGFIGLQRPRVAALASLLTELCNVWPFVGFGAAIIVVALLRRRPRIALGVAAVLVCANVTTELLKALLPSSRYLPGLTHPVASWPSGHATAAMSLALCAVLAAPRLLRPGVAVLGAGFAVAVSYSTLTLEWHYPSDVLGGFLVAGAWALVVIAVLFRTQRTRESDQRTEDGPRLSLRSALTAPAAGGALAAVLIGAVLLIRPHQLLSYARDHTTFIVGAAAIGAIALIVATTVMLVAGSRGPKARI